MFTESRLIELNRFRRPDNTIYRIVATIVIVDSDHGERTFQFACEGLELETIVSITDKQEQKQAFITWVSPIIDHFHKKWIEEVSPTIDHLVEEDLTNIYGDIKLTSITPQSAV